MGHIMVVYAVVRMVGPIHAWESDTYICQWSGSLSTYIAWVDILYKCSINNLYADAQRTAVWACILVEGVGGRGGSEFDTS